MVKPRMVNGIYQTRKSKPWCKYECDLKMKNQESGAKIETQEQAIKAIFFLNSLKKNTLDNKNSPTDKRANKSIRSKKLMHDAIKLEAPSKKFRLIAAPVRYLSKTDNTSAL
jgi:hypothetical protein